MQRSRDVRTTAAPVAGVGGALLIVGSFLNWAELSLDSSRQAFARGTDFSYGWFTFIPGLGVAACAVGWIVGWWRKPLLGIAALLSSATALGMGLFFALARDDRVMDVVALRLASRTDSPVDAVKASLVMIVNHGLASISVQIGLYVIIVGGLMGMLAGVLALIPRQPPQEAPMAEGVNNSDTRPEQ